MGMKVHSHSRVKQVFLQSFKLFVESYFNLAIAVALHTFSFFEIDHDEHHSFIVSYFGNGTDAWISVLNMVFISLVLIAPVYSEYIIRRNQGHLESTKFKEKYEIILEGKTKSLIQAMFTVYFLYRRLLSAIILVFFEQWPFF